MYSIVGTTCSACCSDLPSQAQGPAQLPHKKSGAAGQFRNTHLLTPLTLASREAIATLGQLLFHRRRRVSFCDVRPKFVHFPLCHFLSLFFTLRVKKVLIRYRRTYTTGWTQKQHARSFMGTPVPRTRSTWWSMHFMTPSHPAHRHVAPRHWSSQRSMLLVWAGLWIVGHRWRRKTLLPGINTVIDVECNPNDVVLFSNILLHRDGITWTQWQ